MTSDQQLDRVMRLTAMLGVVVVLGSLYWQSWRISVGVLAGVVVAMVNFWALRRLVASLIAQGKLSAGAGFVFKFGAILGVLFILIRVLGLNAIAVVSGFSTLVVAITVAGATTSVADDVTPDDTQDGETA